MWQVLVEQWNGVSIFIDPHSTPAPDMELYTDASGKGCSGYFHGQWFAMHWPASILIEQGDHLSMSFCELYPIVVSALLWGSTWSSKRILFFCDNMGVVIAINKGRSRSPKIMTLLRRLVLVAAQFSFAYSAEHVTSKNNGIADSLSRFQMSRFRELAPQATEQPCQVPKTVMFA
jgi:hypothetical protein